MARLLVLAVSCSAVMGLAVDIKESNALAAEVAADMTAAGCETAEDCEAKCNLHDCDVECPRQYTSPAGAVAGGFAANMVCNQCLSTCHAENGKCTGLKARCQETSMVCQRMHGIGPYATVASAWSADHGTDGYHTIKALGVSKKTSVVLEECPPIQTCYDLSVPADADCTQLKGDAKKACNEAKEQAQVDVRECTSRNHACYSQRGAHLATDPLLGHYPTVQAAWSNQHSTDGYNRIA